MKKNQVGFSILEGLIVIFTLSVLGLMGWYILQSKAAPSMQQTKSVDQTLELAEKHDELRVTLTDSESRKSLANKDVTIYSQNGYQCIVDNCNNNSGFWSGTTNDSGIIFLPKGNLQELMTIVVRGYSDKNISYSQDQTEYEIILDPQTTN